MHCLQDSGVSYGTDLLDVCVASNSAGKNKNNSPVHCLQDSGVSYGTDSWDVCVASNSAGKNKNNSPVHCLQDSGVSYGTYSWDVCVASISVGNISCDRYRCVRQEFGYLCVRERKGLNPQMVSCIQEHEMGQK